MCPIEVFLCFFFPYVGPKSEAGWHCLIVLPFGFISSDSLPSRADLCYKGHSEHLSAWLLSPSCLKPKGTFLQSLLSELSTAPVGETHDHMGASLERDLRSFNSQIKPLSASSNSSKVPFKSSSHYFGSFCFQ